MTTGHYTYMSDSGIFYDCDLENLKMTASKDKQKTVTTFSDYDDLRHSLAKIAPLDQWQFIGF